MPKLRLEICRIDLNIECFDMESNNFEAESKNEGRGSSDRKEMRTDPLIWEKTWMLSLAIVQSD